MAKKQRRVQRQKHPLGPRSPEEEYRNTGAADPPIVRFLDAAGEIFALRVSQRFGLEWLADRWIRILKSRRSWANSEEMRGAQAQNALADLRLIGLADQDLRRMGGAERVEVVVSLERVEKLQDWQAEWNRRGLRDARRVPWEYLLSAATGALGRERPLSVTRHDPSVGPEGAGGRVAGSPPAPSRLLYVQSAPGKLAKEFDFTSERHMVVGALGFKAEEIVDSINQTASIMERRAKEARPDVIHVAGVDAHQARGLSVPVAGIAGADVDGVVVRDEGNQPTVVDGFTFASAMVSEDKPPQLVVFNLYHSAAELASEAVAYGARAAIGFQDEIDDETAELFLTAFYREWRRAEWSLHEAFYSAWRNMRGNVSQLHGTGIVLWSSRSAFAGSGSAAVSSPTPAVPAELREAKAEDVEVSLDPITEINYALLHNQMPIFQKFILRKLVEGPPAQVEVTVEMDVGRQSAPFRQTVVLSDQHSVAALSETVKIPLTSSLARALRERVHTTLYICVKVAGRIAHQQTERVTLLPVDEWLDDSKQSQWLPSFVLPRDPAVARVVDVAQRYLMALQDDPAAGFDGYQQVDPEDRDTTAAVDLQVRALWYALAYDFRLSYINPPPSYSARTQRLRTPSDVVDGKRGTCIDLALLLAACLEYVDIYPCVILLSGHAFPAYWRSDKAQNDFVLASGAAKPSSSIDSDVSVGRHGWQFRRAYFSQIIQCVQRGDLVPLETVGLTSHTSFETAMQEGLENLRNKREFDSLLDLVRARSNEPPVTPLPILHSEG